MDKQAKEAKIGLCLGGGGVRGIAHLGVLQALEELEIHVSAISGTSAGAIVGCLYANGMGPKEILTEIESSAWYKLFKPSKIRYGLTAHGYLHKILLKNIPHNSFEGLQKPLIVCVTDISQGDFKMVDTGDLIDVVKASSSIPIVFEPVKLKGNLFLDGGLLNNLPVEPLKERGLKVIGVNINAHGEETKLDNMLHIANRVFNMTVWKNTEERWQQCDVKVDVTQAFNIGMFDFGRKDQLFEMGYKAMMAQKKQVLELLN